MNRQNSAIKTHRSRQPERVTFPQSLLLWVSVCTIRMWVSRAWLHSPTLHSPTRPARHVLGEGRVYACMLLIMCCVMRGEVETLGSCNHVSSPTICLWVGGWVCVCRHGQIGLNISLDMVTAPFSPRGTDIALSKLSRLNGFLIYVSSKIKFVSDISQGEIKIYTNQIDTSIRI